MIRKRLIIALILLLLIIVSFLCFSRNDIDIIGEYEFREVAMAGLLSSSMQDYYQVIRVGTKYIITKDSFEIVGEGIDYHRTNVTYKIEVVSDRYIKEYFKIETPLVKILKENDKRYRFVMYDDNDEIIPYYVFLLDDKLLIGDYDTRSKFTLSSVDWVEKME